MLLSFFQAQAQTQQILIEESIPNHTISTPDFLEIRKSTGSHTAKAVQIPKHPRYQSAIRDSEIPEEKCAASWLESIRRADNPRAPSIDDFEQWMDDQMARVRSSQRNVITIPVVVHIVHNGEAIGTLPNVPDAQVYSQLDVLNEDFRRLNADASNTPAPFQPIAADVELEFCLATVDPDGNPSNGITRINGGQGSYSINDLETNIKPLSIWNPEYYLNIWVAPLSGGVLGYGQFPDMSGLAGLPPDIAQTGTAMTDGVVVRDIAFGRGGTATSPFNLGRTCTHEVGHWAGLRHIGGDGGCGMDDFCDDTPSQNGQNNTLVTDCSWPQDDDCDDGPEDLPDMFQNFMDYSDDGCMNLFTADQKARIDVVMLNSPRRASLANSMVCQGIAPPPPPMPERCDITGLELDPQFAPTCDVFGFGDEDEVLACFKIDGISESNLPTDLSKMKVVINGKQFQDKVAGMGFDTYMGEQYFYICVYGIPGNGQQNQTVFVQLEPGCSFASPGLLNVPVCESLCQFTSLDFHEISAPCNSSNNLFSFRMRLGYETLPASGTIDTYINGVLGGSLPVALFPPGPDEVIISYLNFPSTGMFYDVRVEASANDECMVEDENSFIAPEPCDGVTVVPCDISGLSVGSPPMCMEDGTYSICFQLEGVGLPELFFDGKIVIGGEDLTGNLVSYTKIPNGALVCLEGLRTKGVKQDVFIQAESGCTFFQSDLYESPASCQGGVGGQGCDITNVRLRNNSPIICNDNGTYDLRLVIVGEDLPETAANARAIIAGQPRPISSYVLRPNGNVRITVDDIPSRAYEDVDVFIKVEEGCTFTARDLYNEIACTSERIGQVGGDRLVYPNPGTGAFTLNGTSFEHARYELSNALGQLLKVGVLNGELEVIDLKNANNGIYFVRIIDGDNIRINKIIKQ